MTGLKSHESTLLNETRLGVTKTTIYRSNFCAHYIQSHKKPFLFCLIHYINYTLFFAEVWEEPMPIFNKKCSTEFSKNTYVLWKLSIFYYNIKIDVNVRPRLVITAYYSTEIIRNYFNEISLYVI